MHSLPRQELAEAELIEGSRAQERATRETAFEEIHRRLEPGVETVCRRMLGEAEDAEDALQETFLALHQALPSFRGDASLSTYVYRIAVRTALRVRASRRLRRHRPIESEPGAPASKETERDELADAFDAAVAELRPSYRSVFSLCCIDDLSRADVARILGIPEGTVWTRLHRARKELASRLAKWS